ncbi:MAG: hypothetical protein ACLS89_00190 [Collinsella sp.]
MRHRPPSWRPPPLGPRTRSGGGRGLRRPHGLHGQRQGRHRQDAREPGAARQHAQETNTSAAAQSAQLTAAYDTIREYANKSDLSTEAQGRLRAAVDTVNSMCGTQISVVDQANGKLADEHGAIDDVTGALGEYVEKKLNQIRVDAQQSNLTALYEQQAQDLQTLAVAQKNFNDEVDRRVSITPGLTREDAAAAMAWSQQGIALREAKEALGAVNSSIDTVTESLGASVAVADGATASVKDLAAASPAVSSAFVGLGGDIGQFCDDLQNAGISVEDFQSLNDEQLVKLATSWDGTTGSIIRPSATWASSARPRAGGGRQLGQRPKRGAREPSARPSRSRAPRSRSSSAAATTTASPETRR